MVEVVSFVRVHPKRVVVIDFVWRVLKGTHVVEIAVLQVVVWLLNVHLDIILEVGPCIHVRIMIGNAERWSSGFLLFERKATTNAFVSDVRLPIAIERVPVRVAIAVVQVETSLILKL